MFKRLATKIQYLLPRGHIVRIGIARRLQDAPHNAAIVLHVKFVKGQLTGLSADTIFEFVVQRISSGFVNQTVPPTVVNRGRSLYFGIHPSVANACARQSNVGAAVLVLVVFLDNVARNAGNKHAGVGFSKDVPIVVLVGFENVEKALEKDVNVRTHVGFVFWQWFAVGKASACVL